MKVVLYAQSVYASKTLCSFTLVLGVSSQMAAPQQLLRQLRRAHVVLLSQRVAEITLFGHRPRTIEDLDNILDNSVDQGVRTGVTRLLETELLHGC